MTLIHTGHLDTSQAPHFDVMIYMTQLTLSYNHYIYKQSNDSNMLCDYINHHEIEQFK